ncbi:endonuclease I family protein [Bacillus sp. V5-8f]|uniref:endonuclease I family protein n=1 Tax=Bacillus sp. V5-8f TaxID=2053044 RepID=UPI000C75F571|nr:endonuclease [Bacillus sp. V5-8f]PLT35098.1 endonuclease I [Bacillus sp. V5-8f]
MENLKQLSEEFLAAKDLLNKSRQNRRYYDVTVDVGKRNEYYRHISFTEPGLADSIHSLLEQTHTKTLNYTPHLYLYPWVDLHEDGALKSIYSGKGMEPLEAIQHDIRLYENQEKGLITAFQGENLLNCEHVVPQSWFGKKDPMKGDLHHLFACEPGCNSRRGNFPYYDFLDYQPEAQILAVKDGCGKAEEGKFEPEYGKGIVARATLYFMSRYPNEIKRDLVHVPLLLEWHGKFPVSVYEKHRNLAIHDLQGNRNPFIDFPDLAEKINLSFM